MYGERTMRLEALLAVGSSRTVDGRRKSIRYKPNWLVENQRELIGKLTLEVDGNSGSRNGEEGKGKEELLELHDDWKEGSKCSC